jgi:hypothetical protein
MNRLTGENLLETKGGHRECPIPLNHQFRFQSVSSTGLCIEMILEGIHALSDFPEFRLQCCHLRDLHDSLFALLDF